VACVRDSGALLAEASDTGRAIGAGLVVIIWVVVDFLTALTYGIYRLAGGHHERHHDHRTTATAHPAHRAAGTGC
jgi:hypothetical protein